jgi:adenylate cyclase, class 2
MSNNDREIEIKVPLEKSEFSKVRENLRKMAVFVNRSKQVDDYFTPAHRNFVEPRFPFEWLSLRRRGDKVILNYKHYYPENTETNTHCDEFEAEVNNPEKLEKILSAIDMKKLVTVEKERETYNYNNDFEIALDTVKDLGHFIEVEAMKDFGSVESTRERLFEFAKKLGIVSISNADKRGYPFLMMAKKGLIKRQPK